MSEPSEPAYRVPGRAGTLTALDRFLQWWRISKALRHIPSGARVCDIGTYDGRLFDLGGDRIDSGVGVDPELVVSPRIGRFALRAGEFPAALEEHEVFDAITALAVLEHIPRPILQELAKDVSKRLSVGGIFIVTCPTPVVDRILNVLTALRLVKGQSLEQHYGLHPDELVPIFGTQLSLERNEPFQLGVNRLLVFRKAR
jgi:hypothetical protein